MNAVVIGQFESDLAALEACVGAAGLALGCCYSTAEEFEAENIDAWRKRYALDRRILHIRLVLGLTALSALGLLFALAL